MKRAASYIYSTYLPIFQLPLEKILLVGNSAQFGDPIPSFDEKLLIDLCYEALSIFKNESNIIYIEGDTTIIGDIHGSFHDLLRILKHLSKDNSKVLLLGDYVDRGCFSLECITILFTLKVLFPTSFFLIRGNHEFDAICSQYGFKEEILDYHNPKKTKFVLNKGKRVYTDEIDFGKSSSEEEEKAEKKSEPSEDNPFDEYYSNHIHANCYKYTEQLYNSFIEAFSYLPVGAIINKSNLCIHGGLSPLLNKIDNLNTMYKRPVVDFDENKLLTDIVWSDPSYHDDAFFHDNQRGRGQSFNGAIIVNFLKNNSLKRLIRAHQCIKNGTQEQFSHKCFTVFSASSYCKPMGNCSGIVKLIESDDSIIPFHFQPLIRLKKVDASYFKVQSLDDDEERQPICFSISSKALANINGSNSQIRLTHSLDSRRGSSAHFFSAFQGDAKIDVWKTQTIGKNNLATVPRPVQKSINPLRRKTMGALKALKVQQIIQASIQQGNPQISRSSSIPSYQDFDKISKEEPDINGNVPIVPANRFKCTSDNYLPKLRDV